VRLESNDADRTRTIFVLGSDHARGRRLCDFRSEDAIVLRLSNVPVFGDRAGTDFVFLNSRRFQTIGGGLLQRFFVLFVFVVVFAWFRPKNLVYGEAGYRSEKRLEFGTNRRIRNVKEIEAEKGIEDKGLLPPPDEIEVKY